MSAQPAYDLLSLGEVLLRLDPGEGRVRTSRQFTAWEGGGEYNVARGARRCFGLRAGILTAFADNEIGRLIEDLILQGGVDTSLIKWVPYDGMGKRVRNPINFTERGFGVRGLDYAMVGRWLGHMPAGRFAHASIAAAAPVRGERVLGWIVHYATGIVFAGLLLAICGAGWARRPTVLPALVMRRPFTPPWASRLACISATAAGR